MTQYLLFAHKDSRTLFPYLQSALITEGNSTAVWARLTYSLKDFHIKLSVNLPPWLKSEVIQVRLRRWCRLCTLYMEHSFSGFSFWLQGLCLCVCRARTFLLCAEVLTQNSRKARFYLGNNSLISRSAKQPGGQPAATRGRAPVWGPGSEMT